MGYVVMSVIWTPEEIELLRILAAKGVSAPRVAARLGRTERAVIRMAASNSIRFKSKNELRRDYGLSRRASQLTEGI